MIFETTTNRVVPFCSRNAPGSNRSTPHFEVRSGTSLGVGTSNTPPEVTQHPPRPDQARTSSKWSSRVDGGNGIRVVGAHSQPKQSLTRGSLRPTSLIDQHASTSSGTETGGDRTSSGIAGSMVVVFTIGHEGSLGGFACRGLCECAENYNNTLKFVVPGGPLCLRGTRRERKTFCGPLLCG
ncbi:hypothetical protein [Phaffia rhodozyma]|uniref:Uncharacterized protein n=1 Tax=Phaffia rhodozyma TaxID=264483 RepID=A0A0F7SEZ4_PHARH|nr:hypothetical protein [Phaffia rhodozyma]